MTQLFEAQTERERARSSALRLTKWLDEDGTKLPEERSRNCCPSGRCAVLYRPLWADIGSWTAAI